MKSARFTELVKAAGEPEPYTLWMPPEKDRAFQKALKEHRVLSVHQESVGTRADYGTVGFPKDEHAQILIFPRPIEKFAGMKVVGVKYDLLQSPVPKDPVKTEAIQEKRAPKSKQPEKTGRTSASESVPRHSAPEPSPIRKPSREPQPEASAGQEALLAGIRKAMELLDQGKVVAAYRTLEKLERGGDAADRLGSGE